MINGANNVVSLIIGVMAVVAALGAAIAYFSATRAKTIIEIQKETIEAQSARMDEYEARQNMADKKAIEQQSQIDGLRAENTRLADMVTGREAVAALAAATAARYTQLGALMSALVQGQRLMLTHLGLAEQMPAYPKELA